MNPHVPRVAFEGLAALALCAAGYALLVRPSEVRLAERTAEYAAIISKGALPANEISPEQIAGLERQTADRSAEIIRRGAPARDESVMFAAIMDLATRHGVRVDQVRPTTPAPGTTAASSSAQPTTPPPPPGAAPVEPPAVKATTVSYTLSVAGTYGQLAEFIRGISERTGFSVVNAVRITPDDADAEHPLSAQIETEHHAFELPPTIRLTTAAEPTAVHEGTPR